MRIIRMKRTAAGPAGVRSQGQLVTLEQEEAASLVSRGHAEFADGLPGPEIATIEPPDMAVMPRGKAKKKG